MGAVVSVKRVTTFFSLGLLFDVNISCRPLRGHPSPYALIGHIEGFSPLGTLLLILSTDRYRFLTAIHLVAAAGAIEQPAASPQQNPLPIRGH